jgi:hypothetical protein
MSRPDNAQDIKDINEITRRYLADFFAASDADEIDKKRI